MDAAKVDDRTIQLGRRFQIERRLKEISHLLGSKWERPEDKVERDNLCRELIAGGVPEDEVRELL